MAIVNWPVRHLSVLCFWDSTYGQCTFLYTSLYGFWSFINLIIVFLCSWDIWYSTKHHYLAVPQITGFWLNELGGHSRLNQYFAEHLPQNLWYSGVHCVPPEGKLSAHGFPTFWSQMVFSKDSVSTFQGCCIKMPQIGWLKQQKLFFFMVLEAGTSKSRYWQGCVCLLFSSWCCPQPLGVHSL